MTDKTVCRKISAMLSLYIDNKVSSQQRVFIEDHLANCPECYKKYLYLKSMIKDLKASYKHILDLAVKKQQHKMFLIREHENFRNNVSAYVDNELEPKECYEFRKYLMKSKNAQNELKDIYLIQKRMRKIFEETKNSASLNISKSVVSSLRNPQNCSQTGKVYQIKPKMLKIAILSGLVLIGGFEFDQLYKQHNAGHNMPVIQSIKKDFELLKKKKSDKDPVTKYAKLKVNP